MSDEIEASSAQDTVTTAEWLGCAIAVLLALATRLLLLGFASGDYEQFTGAWYSAIRNQGAVEAIRTGVSNYTPLYMYGLSIVAWLFPGMAPVAAIKLVGLPFDFLCAFYVGQIVSLRYTRPLIPMLAAIATLFAPTVVINGSFWGQVDVISTAGMIASVYYLLCGRERAAMVAFGLAFAFKLQAIFLIPFLIVCLLRRRLHWPWLGLVPAIYLAAIVPAWLMGRPLWELLSIYSNQAGYYQRLTSNAAHVYQWLPPTMYEWFYPAGLAWGWGVIVLLALAAASQRIELTRDRLLQLAMLSVLVVPFCLPKMHERYFFSADVLSIAVAFYFPKLTAAAVAISLISFCSYAPFLFRIEIVPMPWLALAMGSVILALIYHYAGAQRRH